ncbi:MAG: MFS transporter [Candidatus Micrarchaeia archaeon]
MNDTGAGLRNGTEMRRLLYVNVLYSFIVAAMAVLVPLYLVKSKVDISLIGIILSAGPLSFMVIRILFASMADEIGTKKISLIYTAANLVSLAFYSLIVTPAGFVLATVAEGVRASGFWAIARTEIFKANGKADPGKTLARFSNMRQLADGLGRVFIGLVLAYLAFSGAFIILFVLSIILLSLMINVKDGRGTLHVDKGTLRRIFKKRPRTFWEAALLQTLVWLAFNMLIGFLVPVYLITSLGMSYEQTGGIVALLSLATGGISILLMRLEIPKARLILLSLVSIPALIWFPFAGNDIIPLIMLISIGLGSSNIIGEYILVDQVYRSKDVSTDIGVLYVPLKICEFLFLSLGGLVIKAWGFYPLFLLLACTTVLLVIFGSMLIAEPLRRHARGKQ